MLDGWTPERHAAARARCLEATPGPWKCWTYETSFDARPHWQVEAGNTRIAVDLTEADAKFIAAARSDLPAALAALERVEALAARCAADAKAARDDACSGDALYGAAAVADMIRAAIRGEEVTDV